MQMAFVEVNGLKTAYFASKNIDYSSGTPLIYIHGAGGSAHAWKNQMQMKFEGYLPIALDLPGHGRSQGQGAVGIEEYRDFIRDFIDTLGWKEVILAGHSMGGAIAQSFALQYLEYLKSMILIGTGAKLKVDPDFLEKVKKGVDLTAYAYSAKTSRELIRKAEKEFPLTPEEVRYRDLLACDGFDVLDRAGQIKARTLIICGRDDYLTPVKYSQFLHNQITGSILKVIYQAGHMVMWEQSEAVNSSIRDFLSAKS